MGRQGSRRTHQLPGTDPGVSTLQVLEAQAEGNTTIVCSNLALGIASDDSTKRHSKATMLCKLTRAELIRMEAGGEKQSPRVSVLETL
jgi:hypothetical protein